MNRLRLLFSVLVVVAASAVLSACGGDEQAGDLEDRLQQIVDRAVEAPETSFPAAALHVSHPELGTWTVVAGEGNVEPPTPMSIDSTFRAGSVMKPLVAAAIIQLAEEDALSLDDPLPGLLPREVVTRFKNADRITARMLLNHTSGLPDYVAVVPRRVAADPRHVWQVEELLDLASAGAPSFAPGAGWAYSNTNYNLLGLVIEEATGRPWREVVRERVIERLSLEHTSLPEPGAVSIGSGDAHGYYRLGTPIFGDVLEASDLGAFEVLEGDLVDMTGLDSSLAGAAGGHALATTTGDLARFLDALLAGELFEQPETLEEMLTFVEVTESGGPNARTGYGLGLERYRPLEGVEVIGHEGGTAGYSAFVGRVPEHELDVAVAITSWDDLYAPLLGPALELMIAEAS